MSGRSASRPALEALEARRLLSVTTYDLSPGSLAATNAMPFGSRTVFSARGDGFGRELWITDGASDTRMIADLKTGAFDSNPVPIAQAGGYLYFFADGSYDPVAKRVQTGLWRTNGKGRDTIFLVPGSPEQFKEARNVGGKLLFIRKGDFIPFEIPPDVAWISDGTPAGTYPLTGKGTAITASVTDVAAPSDASAAYVVTNRTISAGVQQGEVWKFDSSLSAPQKLFTADAIGGVIPMGNTLYISAQIDESRGLWRVTPGKPTVFMRWYFDLLLPDPQPAADVLWFVAKDQSKLDPIQLWRLDGAGLKQMTSFTSGGITADSRFGFTAGGVIFTVYAELWGAGNTDPSAELGYTFADPNPKTAKGATITEIVTVPGAAIVSVTDGSATALWRSLDAQDDATLIGRIDPNSPLSSAGNSAVFSSYDAFGNTQLFAIDATAPAPVQLSRAGGGTGVNPGHFTPFKGGMLLSSGLSGDVGFWFASGSGAPQPLLHVARSDPQYYGGVTDPAQIIAAGDVAYLAFRTDGAFQLWRSDGSAANTTRIGTTLYGNLKFLAADSAGRMYFAELNPDRGRAVVWTTDGTANGTRVVKVFTDFASGSPDPFNRSIVWLGDLYTSYNQRLWRSDGFGMSDETSKLAGIGGNPLEVAGFAISQGKLVIGAKAGTKSYLWSRSSAGALSMPIVAELLGTTTILSLRLADSDKEVWALSRGAGKLILYRIDIAAKTIVASTDVGARGTEGVIEGELGGRAILRTWSFFDATKPSLWLTDGTDADSRWIRNAKDPTAAVVMDGSLYYVSSVGAYRVEGISAASAVTFLGSANNFNGKTSPLAAAGSQLCFSSRKTSVSEGVLGAYHVDRSIQGYVYADANGNGVRDIGDAGLAGWRVFIDTDGDNIWDANETYIRTNSAGRYAFLDLPTGTIRLCITGVGDFTPTSPTIYTVTVAPSLQPRRHFGMEPAG